MRKTAILVTCSVIVSIASRVGGAPYYQTGTLPSYFDGAGPGYSIVPPNPDTFKNIQAGERH